MKKWLRWLKWIPVAGDVMETVTVLHRHLHPTGLAPLYPVEVKESLKATLKSIEEAAGVDLPEDLIDQLIETDIQMIHEYCEKKA